VPNTTEDRTLIREIIENWAVWRDSGDWERLAGTWHSDGRMSATFFQGFASEYVEASRKAFETGAKILHFLGGGSVDIVGERAISQTKMTITQRGTIDDVLVDVVCTGRFYDFFERRRSWKIVRRQPIYESDRLHVIDPAATLNLDPELLARFPTGYRHLAYLQTKSGFDVKPDCPGLTGVEVDELYAAGRAWLADAATPN
jgi:hypothetical protein